MHGDAAGFAVLSFVSVGALAVKEVLEFLAHNTIYSAVGHHLVVDTLQSFRIWAVLLEEQSDTAL